MDVFLFENANNYGNAWRLVKKVCLCRRGNISLKKWQRTDGLVSDGLTLE